MPRLLILIAMMAALAAVATDAVAKPDFSQSTLTLDPAIVHEGDVVTLLVRVRNTGDEPAPFTEVKLDLPLEAMFAGITGLDGVTVDPVSKVMETTVDLPPGADRTFRVQMVVPRDSGGNLLLPSLRVRYLHAGVEFHAGEPITIETRIPNTGIVLGGLRFHPAAFAVLAVLALYPLLRLTGAGRGPVLALVIAIGFWSIFAAMAYDDWRTLNAFHQTTCTILDTRMRSETQSSRLTRTVTSTTTYEPLLALRYDAGGREVLSTGYSTSSRLDIGGGSRLAREYAQWKIGAQVSCWFDPEDPGWVVVLPGFGGAYFFALIPLPLFLAGIWSLRSRRRRR